MLRQLLEYGRGDGGVTVAAAVEDRPVRRGAVGDEGRVIVDVENVEAVRHLHRGTVRDAVEEGLDAGDDADLGIVLIELDLEEGLVAHLLFSSLNMCATSVSGPQPWFVR